MSFQALDAVPVGIRGLKPREAVAKDQGLPAVTEVAASPAGRGEVPAPLARYIDTSLDALR